MDAISPDPDREIGDARVAEAADRRRRRRHEADVEAAESTFEGLLDALAEASATATIQVSGRRERVVVETTAAGWIRVRGDQGLGTLRTRAIAFVEADGLTAAPISTPKPSSAGSIEIADELAGFVGTEVPVLLILADGSRIAGEITAGGIDVVHLRRNGSASRRTYVALDSVNELWSSSRP